MACLFNRTGAQRRLDPAACIDVSDLFRDPAIVPSELTSLLEVKIAFGGFHDATNWSQSGLQIPVIKRNEVQMDPKSLFRINLLRGYHFI